MKDFNTKLFLLAVVAVFIVSQASDFLIHGVILKDTYESLKELWRPDMEDKMWIMMITSAVFSFFFVYIFHFFKKGHFKSGLIPGLCYGFLIGIITVGTGVFNQYVVYNVSLALTWQWFFYGMIQMIIIGIITAMIYKPNPE